MKKADTYLFQEVKKSKTSIKVEAGTKKKAKEILKSLNGRTRYTYLGKE